MLRGTQNLRNASGFTLIELMISVSILAILLAIALPDFQVWIANSKVRTAAESVLSGLQRARSEAVIRNTNIEFVLTDTGSSWVIQLPDGTDIESRSKSEGSKNVGLTVVPANARTITFSNFGFVTGNADGTSTVSQINFDSATLDVAHNHQLQIHVSNPGGKVRMCDPAAAAGSANAC